MSTRTTACTRFACYMYNRYLCVCASFALRVVMALTRQLDDKKDMVEKVLPST